MSKKEANEGVRIELPSPCDELWEKMIGDSKSRQCQSCNLYVHNLSNMTRAEIDTLFSDSQKSGERVCVKFYRRMDGTVLTKDCPLGVWVKLYRHTVNLTYAWSLVILGLVLYFVFRVTSECLTSAISQSFSTITNYQLGQLNSLPGPYEYLWINHPAIAFLHKEDDSYMDANALNYLSKFDAEKVRASLSESGELPIFAVMPRLKDLKLECDWIALQSMPTIPPLRTLELVTGFDQNHSIEHLNCFENHASVFLHLSSFENCASKIALAEIDAVKLPRAKNLKRLELTGTKLTNCGGLKYLQNLTHLQLNLDRHAENILNDLCSVSELRELALYRKNSSELDCENFPEHLETISINHPFSRLVTNLNKWGCPKTIIVKRSFDSVITVRRGEFISFSDSADSLKNLVSQALKENPRIDCVECLDTRLKAPISRLLNEMGFVYQVYSARGGETSDNYLPSRWTFSIKSHVSRTLRQ